MPDRAVVACSRCGYPHPLGMEGDSCMAAARVAVNQPAPRAVVDEYTAFVAGYEAGFGDRYYEQQEPEASYHEWVAANRPEIPRGGQPRALVRNPTMVDRAAVAPECPSCGIQMVWAGFAVRDWRCGGCGQLWSNVNQANPAPRALVAISEDRHWLVTHEANEMPLHFAVWRRAGSHVIGWIFERYVEDTGQDAHEVLAAFLADRGGV
jgi:ribosomal protein S27AE